MDTLSLGVFPLLQGFSRVLLRLHYCRVVSLRGEATVIRENSRMRLTCALVAWRIR